MFVVIFKQHGALNCEQEVYGPFDSYLDAEDACANCVVPPLYKAAQRDELGIEHDNGHRYIQELQWVKGCVL
jgi:hypothetical protein